MNLRTAIASVFSFASRSQGDPAAGGELFSEQAVGAFADKLFGLADPDEILRKAGLTRTALRVLEYDDEIEAALDTRLSAVLAREWRLEPAGPDADKIHAELKPHIEAIISGAWRANLYGYSVMEAVYSKPGKSDRLAVGLAEIAEKPFEWFRPLRDGTLNYRQTFGAERPVDTRLKFFLTRRKATYRNPSGEAILSRLYWPHFFRSSGWRFFARFLERHGAPLLVGQTSGTADKLAAVLARAAQSGAVAVGTGEKVEAIAPNNEGRAFEAFLEMTNRRIQKAVLGQTLTTEVGKGGGSYALGKVHDQVRGDRVLADLRMTRKTVQNVVNALCEVNRIASPPEFVFDTGRDLSPERAERDAKLVDSGIVELSEKYILDRYDFEPGDFTIPGRAPKPADPPPRRGMKASATMFAAGRRARRFTADQAAVEELGDEAIELAGDPVDVEAIREIVRAAESPEDLVERMAERFAALPRDDYRETLERALFAADVLGYAHAEQSAGGQASDQE
jgi:phage gp29-like protein